MNAIPPPQAPYPQEYTQCVVQSAAYYRIPPEIIASIIMVEGGRVGRTSGNTNGTRDMGPMQINTVHTPEFARMGVPKDAIINSACVNIAAGSYILHQELQANPDKPWRAVGNYHSKTPRYRRRYLQKIIKAYRQLQRKFPKYIRYVRQQAIRVAKKNDKAAARK